MTTAILPWVSENFYETVSFTDQICPNKTVSLVKLDSCTMNHCDVSGSVFPRLHADNVQIEKCNFSNVQMEEVHFFKMRFVESKLTGIQFIKPLFEDVFFDHCTIQLAQMRFGSGKKVVFDHCDLSKSDFYEMDMSGWIFKDCILNEAQFSKCKMVGTDIRRSSINNISIDVLQLRGLIVTSDQAMYMAPLLGITISDI